MERIDASAAGPSDSLAPKRESGNSVRDTVSPANGLAVRDLWTQLRSGVALFDPLFFPPICPLCDSDVEARSEYDSDSRTPWWSPFCRLCVQGLRQSDRVMADACRKCGWPLHWSVQGRATTGQQASEFQRPCRSCSSAGSPSEFDQVAAVCRYEGLVRDAVIMGKFPRNASVITAMGHAIADRLRDQQSDPVPGLGTDDNGMGHLRDEEAATAGAAACGFDFVLTVPSHVFRQVPRGGSNAAILGHAVARRLGCPYVTPLRLTRRIAKQAWMADAEARRRNVRGAFRVKHGWKPARRNPTPLSVGGGESSGMQDNLSALLVDDVMTTGATADEIARVLKAAGIAKVSVGVFARALSVQVEPH